MRSIFDFLSKHIKPEKTPLFAYKHGLAAIVYDDVKKIYEVSGELPLDKNSIARLHTYSQKIASDYNKQVDAIKSIAQFYKKNGIRLLVFKGYALSLLYNNPKTRVGCDVDIYLFGDGQKADDLLSKEGIEVGIENEDRHSVFYWNGVHFENHASFINLRILRTLTFFEKYLEDEIHNSSIADKNIDNVYLPSDNFNALYLSFHLACHWISSEITLRHLYDWCIFIHQRGKNVNWEKVYDIANKMGFARFLSSLNGITIQTFELDSSVAPTNGYDEKLAKQILYVATHPNGDKIKGNDFIKNCYLKAIRFFKRQKMRSVVYNQNFVITFVNLSISYLRQFTNIDNTSIWETSHIKKSQQQ